MAHPNNISISALPGMLMNPQLAFERLAENPPVAQTVLLRVALVLGALPPIFAWLGMSRYGWQLGTVEPIIVPGGIALIIALLYFLCLLFGFVSTAYIGRWMATTYGANENIGRYYGLLTIVGAPLTLGSVIHLYPHVFINLLVLVPCLIWSMFLLYRGVPAALEIDPQRGMLMASSMIGYLLVAFVSLLGISAFLWTLGLGPRIGA